MVLIAPAIQRPGAGIQLPGNGGLGLGPFTQQLEGLQDVVRDRRRSDVTDCLGTISHRLIRGRAVRNDLRLFLVSIQRTSSSQGGLTCRTDLLGFHLRDDEGFLVAVLADVGDLGGRDIASFDGIGDQTGQAVVVLDKALGDFSMGTGRQHPDDLVTADTGLAVLTSGYSDEVFRIHQNHEGAFSIEPIAAEIAAVGDMQTIRTGPEAIRIHIDLVHLNDSANFLLYRPAVRIKPIAISAFIQALVGDDLAGQGQRQLRVPDEVHQILGRVLPLLENRHHPGQEGLHSFVAVFLGTLGVTQKVV